VTSEVFYAKAGGTLCDLPERVGRLADAAGFSKAITANLFYLLKVHFGERGNDTYVKPEWLVPLVSRVRGAGGKVFVSDTNALYVGTRSNAVDHLEVAREHGFTYESLGAPVIIADGLVGESQSAVEVNLKHYKRVFVANYARAADGFVVVTNVTGHMLTGLGGAIKNVGMGLCGRGGKRSQHCDLKPEIIAKKCVACGSCVEWCPSGAITVGKTACIDGEKCIGCGECYAICRYGAVKFTWSETSQNMQEKLAEHCFGVLKGKGSRSMFFNFLTSVTKNCNCMGRTESLEVPALGVLASQDIVAIDQASADVCSKAAGKDLFKALYPSWDYTVQLDYAARIGLGTRSYALVEIA